MPAEGRSGRDRVDEVLPSVRAFQSSTTVCRHTSGLCRAGRDSSRRTECAGPDSRRADRRERGSRESRSWRPWSRHPARGWKIERHPDRARSRGAVRGTPHHCRSAARPAWTADSTRSGSCSGQPSRSPPSIGPAEEPLEASDAPLGGAGRARPASSPGPGRAPPGSGRRRPPPRPREGCRDRGRSARAPPRDPGR